MQRFIACVVIGVCLGVCLAIPTGTNSDENAVLSARQADGSIANLVVSIVRPIIQGVTTFLSNVLSPVNRTQPFEGFLTPAQGQEPFDLFSQKDNNANLLKSSFDQQASHEPDTHARMIENN